MKPNFSFKYAEKEMNFAAMDGSVYELGDGVCVRVEANKHDKFDAVEWVLYFENNGEKNSEIFSDIWDSNTLLPLAFREAPKNGHRPTEGDACVVTMNGTVDGVYYWENDKKSATEYAMTNEYLDKTRKKTKSFANIGGRSSDGYMPFFDATALGAGYIVAIGWTGDWKTEFQKVDEGIVLRSGLKETKFYLLPGEKLRTSSTLVMKYGSDEDKYNKFRALIRDHFSHKACTNAARDGIMACEFWGGLPSEEMKKRLAELKAHDIKFEDIWLDAGWYGNCTKCDEPFTGDWSEHTGEWEINKRVHPGELLDVSEAAKAAGANLMLWFEPERAIKGTKIVEEHPEWFITLDGVGSKILNYGNADAYNYIKNLLIDYIGKLEMSTYRQDFNVPLTEYFRKNDEENRRGVSEIKHITGMYRLWDEILSAFPHLLIDNCSSGGRRIDIETLKRSIPFFRSDYQCNFNENSDVLQSHNANISKYLPYNGCTSKTKGDVYAVRSSYSSSWGGAFYNAIFQTMSEEDFAWAKKITDEYASIRRYLSRNFYNHASDSFDATSWSVFQYHDPDSDSGIVMAFRRSNSPFDRVRIRLGGVAAGCCCTAKNFDTEEIISFTDEFEIVLPEKRSSVIFKYKVN